jgi:hypothetical protein
MLGIWGLPNIYAQKFSVTPTVPIDRFAQNVQHSPTRERGMIAPMPDSAVSSKGEIAHRPDGRNFTGREAVPRQLYLLIKDRGEGFGIGCGAVCPGPPNWTWRVAGRFLYSPLSDASPTPPASPL